MMAHVKKQFLTIIIAFIGILVPLQQAHAASFQFNPSARAFERQCQRSIDIIIDATGEISNAAEIEITYDPSQITITDSNTSISGIQVQPGNAFETYFYNQVDIINGRIRVAGASFLGTLSTSRVFATIHFTSSASATNTAFQINYTGLGDTLDSNIADAVTNDDLLSSITNGNYTFFSGPCQADTQGPQIIFVNPVNNAVNVPANSTITVRITDDQSGVELSTVEITINGQVYRYNDPEVVVTGSELNYTFVITPRVQLPPNQASIVNVRAADKAGNQSSRQIIFNVPVVVVTVDNDDPIVTFIDPQNLQTGVGADQDVQIRVTDNLSGVDLNTIRIYLNGTLFSTSDSALTYTGSPLNYLFLLNHSSLIRVDEFNYLRITGSDLDGNQFDRQIIFNVPIQQPLVCPTTPPTDPTDVPVSLPESTTEIKECLGDSLSTEEFNTVVSMYFGGNSGVRPFDGTIFQDTVVSSLSNAIISSSGLAGLLALIAALLFALNLLRFLPIITSPSLLFTLLAYLFGKRRENPWGIVIDAVTRKPIAFSSCRVFLQGTQSPIQQTITDLDGRYGFILQPGMYRIEVKQSGYDVFSEDIEIKYNEQFSQDIQLRPIGSAVEHRFKLSSEVRLLLSRFFSTISRYILFFGVSISIIAYILTPSFLNAFILFIYAILLIILFYPKYLQKRRKYSSVINSENDLRIPFVQIKIYDPQTYRVIDTLTTNFTGQFDYYGAPGKYALLVVAPGYQFPSKRNTLPIAQGSYQSMVLVDLKSGRNEIDIYIDPITSADGSKRVFTSLEPQTISPFAD